MAVSQVVVRVMIPRDADDVPIVAFSGGSEDPG
jgi:hypothetical protein